jgi:tRNA threonylcarbamoyladenosine biosynthesis protein TsaE
MKRYETRSPGETAALGASLARVLHPGDVVALTGDLGTGKTEFVMGVCGALGTRGHLGSPTFTLINEYVFAGGTVVHIDLYRISRREEIADLGLDEYFSGRFICLVEWAERAAEFLPPECRFVRCEHGPAEDERVISIGEPGERLP